MAVKPGQQRTRVMSHSSSTARVDLGRTEEGECRSRGAKVMKSGEKWASWGGSGCLGVGWCSTGGEEGNMIGCRSYGLVVICVWPDLESDGWCGEDERPLGEMGKDDQTTSC